MHVNPWSTSALLLLTTLACTSDPLMPLRERTETEIKAGMTGKAKSADGKLKLEFTLGALREDKLITIETVRGKPKKPHMVGDIYYELGPDPLIFNSPVFITIHAPDNYSDGPLAIANIDGAYPETLPDSLWDSQNEFARGTLEHFSAYALVTVYNPCGALSCGDSCTICDPLDTNCVEPPPAMKACNRSGLCVDVSVASCAPPPPDAGVEDADVAPDSGIEDSGVPVCGETFQQNVQPVVDILIIMDNSGSMYEEQSALGASFDILRDTLTQNNVDFHVGVTSVDVSMTGAQGMLLGNPTILSSSTPNLAQLFAANVQLGLDGGGWEAGLEAAQLALTPPGNPGFLRDNSSLTVIYISDEDDQSVSSTTTYSQFLLGLRGPRRVQANAVVGPAPSGCIGQHGVAEPGPRYDAVRVATGGAFDGICEGPWAGALTDLGGPGFGYLYRFQLVTPVTSVVSVTVDGIPAPPSDWVFDPATQTIEFVESAVPEPGTEIVVETAC